jgi:glycosyltransferase involved in cell wall biosynthesis
MHLMIITPIFPPAQGGAAVYYHLLSEGLISQGYVERITILTERMPGLGKEQFLLNGKLRVIRKFPYRAGGNIGRLTQYFRYAAQNLHYLFIPLLTRKLQPDIVLVHSGFHNFSNIMRFIIPKIKDGIAVISDVRDHLLPTRSLGQLASYDRIIACSENTIAHVIKHPGLVERVSHIPVVQEPLSQIRTSANKTLCKHGLSAKDFMLYAGLIKRGKGVDLLLQTYASLCSKGFQKKLILVGIEKDLSLVSMARQMRGVRLLGPLPRHELLDLMSLSAININLSHSEGMPRASLESLALGNITLLPQGIPEFDRYCQHAVACGSDPKQLAMQIESLISSGSSCNYPLDRHDLDAILLKYAELFDTYAVSPVMWRENSKIVQQQDGYLASKPTRSVHK